MGTPALPTAEITEIRIHNRTVPAVSSTPPFCITKREVTRINAAQPFMLMVQQRGSTKRETSFLAFRLFSAEEIVTGSVATELLVKNAIITAGSMFLKTLKGLIRQARRNSGRITKNWSRLPPSTTATYLPTDPTRFPAPLIWAASCAENATIPSGRVQTKALISTKNNSYKPLIPFRRTCTFSDWGIRASARPTAAAISRMLNTLPLLTGFTTLSGTTARI